MQTYYNDNRGYEEWYNEHGNVIHWINHRTDREEWAKYDQKGNMIYTIDKEGHETWYEFDDHGKCIYRRFGRRANLKALEEIIKGYEKS